MNRAPAIGYAALLVALLAGHAGHAAAQSHEHPATGAEKLGSAHFATSCAQSVYPQFDRSVTLLHSFEFGSAIQGFGDVLKTDPECAMAQWGIALSRWSNPMAPGIRSPAELEQGHLAAMAATRLGTRATARERQYIAAVNLLYADFDHVQQSARIVAYEKAMADVAADNPADTEATIFYAIALVAAAPPTDKTYANQLKAGAILEALWLKQPDHPGLAHYIIHAYDVPALAPRAKAAAERYSEIAPSAAHALHMPSHTFTRVGMWQESINTNLRSIDAARRESAIGEMLHASDYAVYAYLQLRNDAAARKIVDGLPAAAAKFNPAVVTGAAPPAAAIFALAAIPARYALERRSWKEAAALLPKPTALPYTDAMTWFARALGSAHLRELARTRNAVDSLNAIHDRLIAAGELYWAEQVMIESLEARAALRLAEGNRDDALADMREAARREDATEKSAISPGPIVPAHELYGDVLMEAKQPANALAEYRKSMLKEPNRFRALYGAMRAARSTGDQASAIEYAAQIGKLTGSSAFARQ